MATRGREREREREIHMIIIHAQGEGERSGDDVFWIRAWPGPYSGYPLGRFGSFTADEGDFKHLQQSESVPTFRKGYADVVGLGG